MTHVLNICSVFRLNVKTVSFERSKRGMQENQVWKIQFLVYGDLQIESLPQPKRLQNLASYHTLLMHSLPLLLSQSWFLECQICFIACVSPWNSLLPDILILHTLYFMSPSFLASLYKIESQTSHTPLHYLTLHHSAWHHITHLFDNLFIASVSHWNMRPMWQGHCLIHCSILLCLE